MKRFFLYSFLAFFLFTAAVFYSQKDRLHDYASNTLTVLFEEQTSCQIRLGPISFSFIPLNIYLSDVTIISKEEPIATIDRLTIQLSLWDLLHQTIGVKSIDINTASLFSLPNLSDSHQELSWNSLEHIVRLHSIQIQSLHLSPEIAALLSKNSFPILEVAAKAEIDPKRQEAFFDVWLTNVDNLKSRTCFSVGLKQKEELLQIQLRTIENENSLLTSLYNLPKGYNYQFFIHAASKLHEWRNIFQARPENVNGSFQICYSSFAPSESLLGHKGYLEGDFGFSRNEGFHVPYIAGNLSDMDMVGVCHLDPNNQFHNSSFYLDPGQEFLEVLEPITIKTLPIKLIVDGPFNAPKISCKASSETIIFDNQRIDHLEVECNYSHQKGDVKISGLYENQPIQLLSAFEWGDKVQFQDIHFHAPQTELSGNVDFTFSNREISAKLSGTTAGHLLSELFALEFSPVLSFQAHLEGTLDRHKLHLDVTAPLLKYGDMAFEQSQVTITGFDLLDHPRGHVQLSCQSSFAYKTAFKNFNLDTSFNFSGQPESYTLNLEPLEMPPIISQGHWTSNGNTYSIFIQNLEGGTKGGHKFKLIQPAEITYQKECLGFSPLCFDWSGCTVKLTPEIALNSFTLAFQALNLPLKYLQPYNSALPETGTIDLYAALTQLPTTFSGQAKLNFKDLSLVGSTFPLTGELSFHLKEKELLCDGFIEGIGDEPMKISAQIPIFMQLAPFEFRWEKELPISAKCNLHSPLEPILEMALPAFPVITGHAFLNLNITGTLSAPSFSGEADLKSGSLDLAGLGMRFDDVDAHIDLENSEALLTSFSGKDGEGSIQGSGKIDLDPSKAFPFDITFQLNQTSYRPSDYAKAIIKGTLQLKGDRNEGNLSGAVTSGHSEVSIPQEIPELAQTVEVTYINPPDGNLPPLASSSTRSEWPLNLDIQFEVPEKGMIKGKDWSSEWQGHIAMKGTANKPLLWGSCKLLQGEYRLNGHPFEIKEGTITFTGELKKKTTLYVIASRDLDELTAEIIVKGPIRDPSVSLRSNPPMSQREILSWLLFNRGTEDITPFQGTELNESITNLNMSSQPDMLTRLRNSFGVDKIDINRGSSNEVSIQLGKYISQGILVSVNKSVTAEANQVAIEAEIMENVKVQAQLGDDSQGQLRLKWRKDY